MYSASKAIGFGEITQIRAITPFKVVQGHRCRYQGRYQSKARMRPLISDKLTDILSYSFEVTANYCLNFGLFWAFLGGGSLEATYTVHLKLVGKFVVDFLFVLIELFSQGVTAEVIRANIDWKSALLKGVGQFRPNFHVVGNIPPEPFLPG